MSQSASTPRVPLRARAQLPAEARPIYDHIQAARGQGAVSNAFKALGHSPHALEKVAAVGEYVRYAAGLDPTLRELAILTVAQETGCPYEWAHHWHIAAELGIPERLRGAVGTPTIEREPPPLGPALRYVRLVARNDPVDDSTADAVTASLGEKTFVDLTVLAGYYGLLGRLINALRPPLDDGVAPAPFVVRG